MMFPEARLGSEVVLQLPNEFVDTSIANSAVGVTLSPVLAEAAESDFASSTDEGLVAAVAEGSREALSQLFRRHGRAVRHVAYRILKDESEAADLRQDVFLYVFEHAEHFEPKKATAISWIMQVAYHRAFDRRRYLVHRHHYKLEGIDEHLLVSNEVGTDVDRIDGRIVLEKLRRHLSDHQRKTLELHIFEGYSFREIAKRTGQSLGNVQHNYYRAIERLRANLFSRTNQME
jgi:RNA polymerase sigma-70 factor (ECF subfamily)